MRKNIALLVMSICLLFSVTLFTSCDFGFIDNSNDNNSNENTTGDDQNQDQEDEKFWIDAPVVTITNEYINWASIDSMIGYYEVNINGVSEYYNTSRNYLTATETSTVKVRYVDLEHKPISDWSNEVTYTKPNPIYVYVTYKSAAYGFEEYTEKIEVGVNGLARPTLAGYEFYAWYIDEELTKLAEYNVLSADINSITLYGKFVPNVYKLQYNDYRVSVDFMSDGNVIGHDTVTPSTPTLEFPNQPTKEGYTFTGWYYDEECTRFFELDTCLTEDTVVYAGWRKNSSLYINYSFNNADYDWQYKNWKNDDISTSIKVPSSASFSAPIRLSFYTREEKTYELQYRTYTYHGKSKMYFVNETTGKKISDVTVGFSDDYLSIEFEGKPGNLYSIYLYNSSENPKVDFILKGSKSEVFPYVPDCSYLTYNEHFTLPVIEKENLQFNGYFTKENGEGVQITDSEGNSISPFRFTENTHIYPYYSDITSSVN